MKLRKATSRDNEFAFQTKKAAFKIYVDMVWKWDEEEQRKMHEERFNDQFQIIQISGKDIGILTTLKTEDCLNINQLLIIPEYQNQGIGKRCMLNVLEAAKKENLPVRLRVLKVNPRAHNFYKDLEFRKIGETDTHIELERSIQQ